MKETEMHVLAIIGTILLIGVMTAPVLVWSGPAHAGPDFDLDNMEIMEAELAMKSEEAPKQPQKVKRAPDPVIDEKIGGDPTAKIEACKTDAECGAGQICRSGKCIKDPAAKPRKDDPIDLSQFEHKTDDDEADIGDTQTAKIGSFDGSEFGWADSNKGDPYVLELVRDVRALWEYPEISSDEGIPVGCFHLLAEGKIPEVDLRKPSGNPELDDSVQRAMNAVMKARNDNPVAVPTHLLQVTTKWLCLRFNPKGS